MAERRGELLLDALGLDLPRHVLALGDDRNDVPLGIDQRRDRPLTHQGDAVAPRVADPQAGQRLAGLGLPPPEAPEPRRHPPRPQGLLAAPAQPPPPPSPKKLGRRRDPPGP